MNSFYRHLYTLLLYLLSPLILVHLFRRSRKQPEYLQHIPERFGRYSAHNGKPVIWLHTVSVGETRAAASLVQQLRASHPDHQIVLTHTTPTGRSTSEQLYGDRVTRIYLPYDFPFAIDRFLNHFHPSIGVLMETEIWFNLIHACWMRNVPLLLLNARLSEKSASRYARFARLTRNGLQELSAIAAQTTDDAARFTALGAKNVSVMGNLKFDIEPPAAMLDLGKQLRTLFGEDRKVLLLASTREGEEALLLDALANAHIPGLLTIFVPRHPQRFEEVASMITRRNFKFQRRSENNAISSDTQIVLGDSMGEMFAYYAASDIAYIGGSLLPFGGQNLIEACAVGTPVLIGPHTFNFSQATELAINRGAAIRFNDASEMIALLPQLLSDIPRRQRMGKAGLEFVRANQGATSNALSLISRYQNGASGGEDENQSRAPLHRDRI